MTNTQYTRQLLIWMAVYGVLLFASISYIEAHMDSLWRFPVAIAPMIPVIFVARVVVARLARLDELQRRIQFTALSVTVLVTALITFSYGLLENVGFPIVNVMWVWPLMGATWGISGFVANRHYQ